MAKPKPFTLPTPNNILHEAPYRGRRICGTDDPRVIGEYKDKWGFSPNVGYVVLDEFDENVFPVGMHWFFTPDDAASAIEMMDTILPTIKLGQSTTTLLFEYGLMRCYRRDFWKVYNAIVRMQRTVNTAAALDDDVTSDIRNELSLLRQTIAEGPGKGFE